MKGWIVALVAVMVIAIALAGAALLLLRPGGDTIILDLEAGDCFQVPEDIANSTISKIDTISCAKPHEAEVFATGEPKLISYGISDEEAWAVGLPCGGEIDVFVEKLS